MRSLRSRLFVVWVLSLAAAVAVGVLMSQIYARSSSLAESRAQDTVSRACDQIRETFRYYDTGWTNNSAPQPDAALKRDLGAVLAIALGEESGLRAGIWQPEQGLLAQFPQDASDFPHADTWRDAVTRAADRDRDTVSASESGAEQTLVAACLLPEPGPTLVGFVATRVASAAGLRELQMGIGLLLVLVLAIAGSLTWLVMAWARHVRKIELALAGHAAGPSGADGTGAAGLPMLSLTGERELDRIVTALNIANARVEAAHRDALVADARMVASEKLAALGRVAAGVAHEIRNPIAAMRLRAENALAGDDTRRRTALDGILGQIARLDRLLAEMLAMTQSRDPTPSGIDLAVFLVECARDHSDEAARAGVELLVDGQGAGQLDTAMIRRAVSNLLQNAIRETPSGSAVRLAGSVMAGHLRIEVSDSGRGVPTGLVDRLFEPFVTGRADGTGLGLAIARELVTAHGGSLGLAPSNGAGARFVIELPQPDVAKAA